MARLLICEDGADICSAINQFLQDEGHAILEAHNDYEGILGTIGNFSDTIAPHYIVLLLKDCFMPFLHTSQEEENGIRQINF